MSLSDSQLRNQWALKGALARLEEINAEVKAIHEAFPELRNLGKGRGVALPAVGNVGKKRRVMSPEARKRMSEGMRKFWLRRKAAAKAAKAKRD